MGLFDTPAVKELRKQTQLIGSMHGQVYLGHLPQRDLEDVVRDEEFRSRLRSAYAAAVADVGEKKALKAAVSEAHIWAQAAGRLRQANYGDMVLAAERSVLEMLGESAADDVGRRGRGGREPRSEKERTSRRYLASAPPGPRTELLAVASVFQAMSWPCSAADRAGTVIGRDELAVATEKVRSLLVQDRDLSAQIARKVLLQLNHLLRAGGRNEDMSKGDRSGEMILLALNEVGLRPVDVTDGGEVTLEISALNTPDYDTVFAMRIARQALAVLFAVLGNGSPRDRQFYVQLHTGKGNTDVESTAYQITAWGAILTARLINTGVLAGFRAEYATVIPMAGPGWYPNPYNTGPILDGDASFQRFWDGRWTDRVRVRNSGRWLEQSHSLHDPPPD